MERLGALVLSSEPLPAPTPDAARPLLLQLLRERGLRRALFGGDAAGKAHPALELVARVRLLRALAPEAGWPRWDEAGLLAAAEDEGGWLSPALQRSTSLKQLAAADLPSLLSQSLPYEMQVRLREEAPPTLEVPSGASVRLSYVRENSNPLAAAGWRGGGGGGGGGGGAVGWGVAAAAAAGEVAAEAAAEVAAAGAAEVAEEEEEEEAEAAEEAEVELEVPVLAAKLQEWFGAAETPRVGPRGATVPVLLHLLTPAGRPAAITADLRSFWAGPYSQVRAELRDKYKRHPWPDDPANAAPTKLTNNALTKLQARQAAEDDSGVGGGGGSGGGGGGGGGGASKKGGGAAKPGAKKAGKGGKLPGSNKKGKGGPFKRR